MDKRLFLVAATGLALWATPAAATFTIDATVTKTKDILVTEDINITKDVVLETFVVRQVDKAAEADSVVNQSNTDNKACGSCAEKYDVIMNSVHHNAGALSVNQAAGNMNNQANVITASVDFDTNGDIPPPPPDTEVPPGTGAFANAQSSVDQRNGVIKTYEGEPGTPIDPDNVGYQAAGNIIDSINILFREARIVNSINSNLGVTHVNQATGQINNQTNVLTLAAGLSGGVALAESDLGQYNANNESHEAFVDRRAAMFLSVNDNHGVVGVNQTAGNLANQANVVAVGAAVFANNPI